MKKVLGILFIVFAVLAVVGAVANGSLFSDRGSGAETFGAFLGTLIPVVLFVFSGIFLISFDKVYKLSYIEGVKARKKQCNTIIAFLVIYIVLLVFVGMAAGAKAVYSEYNGIIEMIFGYVVQTLPYFVPLVVFGVMYSMYVLSFSACRKNFKYDDAMLNEYLSYNEVFYTYSKNNSVLASNKALFFPKLFCVIPFAYIADIKQTNIIIEQDVYFTLTNGKKIALVTREYNSIMAAVNANR